MLLPDNHPLDGSAGAGVTDTELLNRILAGDRRAFASLYDRHHAVVFRFARLMTGSEEVAQDIVQDVFVALMLSPAGYDDTRASFTTYLYGMARNQTRMHLRRQRRLVSIDEERRSRDWAAPDADTPGVDLLQREAVSRLRTVMMSLPWRYREVIVLCDLHDMPYADAAAVLSCAVGTVRSRLHRGRAMLAERIRRRDCRQSSSAPTLLRCV